MSLAEPLLHNTPKPLFATWLQAVGAQVATTTQISVVGGLYIQAREIRYTTDIDVVVKSGPLIDRFQIRNKIAELDRRCTVNAEKICGLTYCEKIEDPVTPIDIIEENVTLYMPEGMSLLDVVNNGTISLPTDSEAIAMKIIAASDRLKMPKAVQDFDDGMNIISELYHEGGHIAYKDEKAKEVVTISFNRFYPRYKEAKEEAGEKEGDGFWTEEKWKVFLKID